MPDKIALIRAKTYADPRLFEQIGLMLAHSGIKLKTGQKVLVKPNLLQAHGLACAHPQVVAGVCAYLLDFGTQVTVSDSPAFGSCEAVAESIGLGQALKPLGLGVNNFSAGQKINLPVKGKPAITVARQALEADLLFSVAKVKAHSQVRVTLSVKNCYGCLLGLRKAVAHARFGRSLGHFCDCVAALWASLPPVIGVADGILAMSGTGPRLGKPYALGVLGASSSAPALDLAIMEILKIPLQDAPVAEALQRRGVRTLAEYPLKQPEELAVDDFEVPKVLKDISFNPLALAKSLARRLIAALKN